jgi:superfamily II DNA or RNA helicase
VDRRVLEYHSGNTELGPEIFRHFEQGGVLLAIKCLDEGVDLPFINKALILASTTNPREYIQRRGRVLRAFDSKYSAEIIDIVVTDQDGVPIAISELDRAQEFAKDAANRAGRLALDMLARRVGGRADAWRRDCTSMEEEETGGTHE